jgi:CheY-like chemotaxis protein
MILRTLPACASAAAILLTSTHRAPPLDGASASTDVVYLAKPVGQYPLIRAVRDLLGSRPKAGLRPVIPFPVPAPALPAMRVLIAEDNAVNQRLIAQLLLDRGHQVTVVGNGRQAVDEVARGEYDLVLMDLQMPEMDGLEAAAIIRARERLTHLRVPIVALTAHAMEGDRQRCLDAQMDEYLAKPITPGALFHVIDRVMAAAT